MTDFLTNTNNFFEVGGTLGNPNVLAIILVFTILSAIYILGETHTTLSRNLLFAYIFVAFAEIVLTRCRSALLGCMVIGFFLLKSNRTPINRTIKILLISVLALAGSCFMLFVYQKSESLTGRLLIWQASFIKILEKPFWGYGISSFQRVYPDAQRIFLETNPKPAYLQVADNPKWAYNDFIELWLEGGVFTALAFLMLLSSVLYCFKLRKRVIANRDKIAFLSVVVFFVLSVFNFAITAWPILLIFAISLAWCSSLCPEIIQLRFSRKLWPNLIFSVALLSGSVFVTATAFKNLVFQYQFNTAVSLPIDSQRTFYSRSANDYQSYAPFAFRYATFLFSDNKHSEAIMVLRHIYDYEPSYQTAFRLAETYLTMNDPINAKRYYEEAVNYLPNRIMPRYHLFMIALLDKNYARADSIKKQTINLDYKGDTTIINQIKQSLCKYNIISKSHEGLDVGRK